MTRQTLTQRISIASLLLASLAAAAAVACGNAEAATQQSSEQVLSVSTTDVALRTVPKTLTVTGTLLANRESEVAADVAGRVVATEIERGSFVGKGQLLARLDARGATLSRSEASAQVEASRVQKNNARIECERAERLFQASVISRSELDRVRAACESSDFSTAAAQAREGLAAKALSDSSIRAPFAGMIVERDITVGEYVTVGKRIATLVELNPLRLELTIPESASAVVREGSSVEFALEAFPDQNFIGQVRYVGPVLRRATRDLIVEAVVDNKDGRLRPGMFAEARLRLGEQQLPTVPTTALVGVEPSLRAFVVQNGVAEERIVLAGSADDGNTSILKGLHAGERVVNRPSPELRDGLRVR